MGEATSDSPPPMDITSHLPLQLLKYESLPPAPSRSESGSEPPADFLLDFAGYSWIAYGSSTLVVISHFPNPLLEAETELGPIYRQVIELSREAVGRVSAVSWSPAKPSVGELAVVLGDCIVLLSHNEDKFLSSSFCWSQTAILVQSMKVEIIKWTGSGDGLISGGAEVVMWRRKEKSWEIAWSFKPTVPQMLVSTSWSTDGLSATASGSKAKVSSSPSSEAEKCVLVCQGDGHLLSELHHPMPVSMIQWRPTGNLSSRYSRHALRPVLLTCCLDGAVRLWGATDDGRIRRAGKDSSDHQKTELSFYVIAVIEVNQTLNGFLGSDIFVHWATEVEGVSILGGEACYFSCTDDLRHETAGRCEWLIGFGPKNVATFWAIHCLDEFAPVRFPRVTLWKKQHLTRFEMETAQLLVHKILMMRTQDSGPPVFCSLVQLLPSNSFAWAHLYSEASKSVEGKFSNDSYTENSLTACAKGFLEVEGHTGKIIQLAIHPFSFEVELAASLDANGTVLFWAFSTFYNSHVGLPTSSPHWKFCGKSSFSDHSPNYSCLCWAPTLLGKDQVLLMGHDDGIDCFVVGISNSDEEKNPIHKVFSIPFSIRGYGQRLSRVCSVPLPSICNGKSVSSKFLLLALWMDCFQALSWEITIHSCELQGNSCNEHLRTFEIEICGKKYSVSVDPSSSAFLAPHNDDKVTSCAVVNPSDLAWSEQKLSSSDGMDCCGYAYHIITGCINGCLKLWRSMPAQSSKLNTNWDLVGVFTSEEGPIQAISPSACCLKIATVSKTNLKNYSHTLCIWGCMHVQGAGDFMLEDKLGFDEEIVTLKWLRLGNGQLLLGVCLQNELRVYALRRYGGQSILKCEKTSEGNAWICIAVNSALPSISDFIWGPKGTAVVIHDEYFCLFSHFLLSEYTGSDKHTPIPTFSDPQRAQLEIIEAQCQARYSTKMNADSNLKSVTNVESCQSTCNFANRLYFWSMSEIAKIIGGSLPLFHPEALLSNIYSGNWKRAFIALRHLVQHLASNSLSEQGYGVKTPSNIIFPVPLSDYFEGLLSQSSGDKLFQWSSSSLQTGLSQFTSLGGFDDLNTSIMSSSRSEFDDFVEALESLYHYMYITEAEKMQALALIDLLREVSNPHSTSAYGSLDEPGRRFWVTMRFQQLYFTRRLNRLPLVEELVASSEMIGWAFHSDCHDNLFDSLLSKEPSWEEMRSMGVGFWYTNVTQLRATMERLARQQYMKHKDPRASTLLYIALNRLQVLSGLFKISKDDKDKPLAGFLSRNFQEDKNKEAALKNAYVLLGKHQLELAIAFFLLGGDASSAVTVCAKNLGDEQLALVICHLLEGSGGPLKRHLISNFLLPAALSNGDFWMASFLEWVLGNYSKSFLRMLGVEMGSEDNISLLLSSHASFLDPSIGQYCFILAVKTSMKNAIGEFNAAVLCRWAALLNVASFSRCGLHLEALEGLSSSFNLFGGPIHGVQMHSLTSYLLETVKPSVDRSSSNWLSDEMSCHFTSHCKLHLAMQYISYMLREHPSCAVDRSLSGEFVSHEGESREFENFMKEFEDNLTSTIAYFQQKFSLVPCHLITMIGSYLHCNGLEFVGHYVLQEYIPKFLSPEKSDGTDNLVRCPFNLLLKATEEISCLYVNYVIASCQNCYSSKYLAGNCLDAESRFCWLAAWGFSNQGIVWAFWHLRAMLQLFLRSHSKDILKLLFTILELFEYNVLFSSAWLQKNFKALLITVEPLLATLTRGRVAYDIKMEDLNKHFAEVVKLISKDFSCLELGAHVENNEPKQELCVEVPVDEIWHVMAASIWVHMAKYLEHQLVLLSEELNPPLSNGNSNSLWLHIQSVSSTLIHFQKLTCTDVSSYCSKQFATYLLQEVKESNKSKLFYFEDGPSQAGAARNHQMSENTSRKILSDFEELWRICNDRKIIHEALWQEYHNWLTYYKQRPSSDWSDAYTYISREFGSDETCDKDDRVGSPSHSGGSPLACLSPDDHPFKGSSGKDSHDSKRVMPFQNPKDIYKRNGELLEALCINSVDQCQAALACNKKGIIFFNWEDGILRRGESKYIWEEADWPHNGWAGSESIPVPTCVSPGVGLGSKEGAHVGLGGAAIGAGALVRPGRGLKGGAFGLPGYAGVGASSLGWGVQDGVDEYLDPPATVDNVRTRAFASHPSRSFFLVGSSNTHVYLWEFGKDKATATYGVLPAANVPPPYALASVSALRFDHCGHRFVTGALDGTVCTWQLEVGGRSNICPTESSVCFNNHTADVTYVTASGSIVAAAGYSSNGVNVVVWDTLAPPATSKASIMCHEGGARSLSVFDNDIGSGSISPLILTGGKGGDVGLHDFRYIATGRTKKHKHLETGDHNMHSSSVDMRSKTGDQNRNGMLWYIPKAHSGSVTKICTIPNTSFFLTGSKDGDVKLWDAKRAKLVYHWPRLHERHTFLQPSSRGFGGVVRAAVTDIQAVTHGFLTCGGDGLVKFVGFPDFSPAASS